ncbi:MAG: hypothetical protein L3J24_06465 [Xanthomonadales bacterium]|nr:hypothetical protein [Xanthomonadales bacterium]
MYVDDDLRREFNPSVDLTWLSLSKAQKLLCLQAKLSSCRILPIFTFTANEWLQQSGEILNRISNQFDKEDLIVRSSSTEEDCRYLSNAGAFKSILNVSALSESALHNAIKQVVDSMPGEGMDEVLVQPMMTNFHYAGVASSHCLVNESPY